MSLSQLRSEVKLGLSTGVCAYIKLDTQLYCDTQTTKVKLNTCY